jgi:hypothetical protein
MPISKGDYCAVRRQCQCSVAWAFFAYCELDFVSGMFSGVQTSALPAYITPVIRRNALITF